MTAVDAKVDPLKHLEFDPKCELKLDDRPCPRAAAWSMRCRACGNTTLICTAHLEQHRIAASKARGTMCLACGRARPSMDLCVDVQPLGGLS